MLAKIIHRQFSTIAGKNRVAFIGLGNMGGPMSGHLVGHGFNVNGFDLSKDMLEAAQKKVSRDYLMRSILIKAEEVNHFSFIRASILLAALQRLLRMWITL